MIFILENIRSKFNIGSIFRSCDAFQVEKLILTGYSCTPPDKEISKTAIGAENFVKWQYYQNIETAISDLKTQGRKIIGIEINNQAIDINNYKFEGNEVLIFGNEIDGVSDNAQSQCDAIIKIPINGKVKESLNVGVTAGIVGAIIALSS